MNRRDFLRSTAGGAIIIGSIMELNPPESIAAPKPLPSPKFQVTGGHPGATVAVYRYEDMKELTLGHLDEEGCYEATLDVPTDGYTEVVVRVRHAECLPIQDVTAIGQGVDLIYSPLRMIKDWAI